jgi:zinc protease
VEDGAIARGLAALLTEAERVRRFGFTTAEFDRQKAALLRSIEIQYDEREKTESNNFAGRYIDHYLTSDPMLGIEVRSPLIRALVPTITAAQVNAVAAQWLVDKNRVILASAPAKPGVVVPTEAELIAVINQVGASAIVAHTDVAPDAPLIATPPAPGKIVSEKKNAVLGTTEWTLSNGVHVIVKPTTFQADEVLISGVSLGGIGIQSPTRYFSALLGPLLLERGGAGGLDADALQKHMMGKVAAVSAAVDQRGESVSGKASPKDLQPFFEMLWAKTQLPRVDSSAITAFKQQYTTVFKNRANDPSAVFADTIGATMTSYNPLARPVSAGLVDSLDIQVGLEAFRDRFKDFSDFTFVIVGAIQPDDVRPYVEKWIAALPGGGRKETPKDPGIRPPTGVITKVVHKGVEPQAHTTMVLSGMIPWTPDAARRAEAISEILDIRLRNALREDLGGTYDVGAGVALERWPEGRFTASVSFGAAPGRIDSLANVAIAMLRRFAAEGPTKDELAKVRENMTRSREAAMTQNGFWASLFEAQAMWGDDPVENVTGFKARVAALDADSIRALARIVLNETNFARFTLLPEKAGGGQ